MCAVSRQTIAFILNERPVSIDTDPARSLLDVLREDFGITSPKNGCAPQGACGCCTVLVDGQPKLSCTMKIARVAGGRVTTAEGLADPLRQQIAAAFVRAGGVQCGFCTPGITMRTVALLEKDPDPSPEKIRRELRPHLCRCTGYQKIVDAIQLLARLRRGEASPAAETNGQVGTRLERYRGRQHILGEFRYVDDLRVPDMRFAALRFSDHPRALVRSIDPSPALALPGVEGIFTAADVPGERYVGLIERDWPVLVAVGEETRYVGDVLAVAVAKDAETARIAAAGIRIDYEVRPPVVTPEDALRPDAPQLHPKGNLLSHSVIRRGDVDDAFRRAAHVVTGTYTTQRIEHMFLEPEACLVVPGLDSAGGVARLKVFSQTQGVFDDRRQIAAILGWPLDRVHVELVPNGGAFGGKEDMSVQGQTALAAALCGRPVKCALMREESFRLHPKRHPTKVDIQVGCDAEGHLLAARVRIIGDTGAYASVGGKVLERAAGHAVGPYKLPAIDIESRAAYTNNPPCGAMRGFGVCQGAFAFERCLDRLAQQVGLDGWEIRWRNALDVGDRFCTGQRMDKPFGLKATLQAVKDSYRGARFAGIACGVKNCGLGNGVPDLGKAVLRVESADRVALHTAFTEMGQGHHTICIQVACQETGLPPEVFRPTTDTSVEINCGQTTASRATVLGGLAVMQAARRLRAELDQGRTLADLIGRDFRGEYACTWTTPLEADVPEPKTHLSYGFATQVVILNDDGTLKKVVAAHDVGRVMNPTLLEGQIEGAIHMGLGYALTEEFVVEGGWVKTNTVRSLNVLRAHHMPEIESIFVEAGDPDTPYGARGVGEIGLVPTAPAVAGALEAFDGLHRMSLPMRDSPAARAILGRTGSA